MMNAMCDAQHLLRAAGLGDVSNGNSDTAECELTPARDRVHPEKMSQEVIKGFPAHLTN
jgi:hypothetical protein